MISLIVRSLIGRILILINIFAVAVFLCCSLHPYLNVEINFSSGFLGILFPYSLLMLIACFLINLVLKPIWAVIIFATLFLNSKQIFKLIAPNCYPSSFEINKNSNIIRILCWNVKRFLPENENNINNSVLSNEHIDFIKKYNPDIICLQEFLLKSDNWPVQNSIKKIMESSNCKYFYFSEDYKINNVFSSGNIIFSKHKILNQDLIKFSKINAGLESIIYVDIETDSKRRIRIFNTHLQSYGFKPEEYKKIEIRKNNNDNKKEISKSIFSKMRSSFLIRNKQARLLKSYLDSTTIPIILCGDFNDVPNSITYLKLSEKMKDAFLEKGFSIGRTFKELAPTLRIDYILCSKIFDVKQFEISPCELSDHLPIIADVEIR